MFTRIIDTLYYYIYLLKIFFLRFLNFCIKKDKNLLLFISYPTYTDNPFYLYQHIKTHTNKGFKLVRLARNKSDEQIFRDNNIVFIREKNIFQLFRAKYLITSHGCPIRKVKQQISIDLWHGLPLKTLGYKDRMRTSIDKKISDKQTKLVDYFITTSEVFGYIFSSILKINPNNIKILGQPRNDVYLKKNDSFIDNLYNQYQITPLDKIIFYVPTYRGNKFSFSKDNSIDGIPLFSKEPQSEIKKLENYLRKNNIKILVKVHPIEENILLGFNLPFNCHILTTQVLKEHNKTIYDIMHISDALITDYSSIYFDYLLLNKPILFYVKDIKEYKERRGLLYENLDMRMPGYKVNSLNELIEYIEKIKTKDIFKNQRTQLKNIAFKYNDQCNSKRIFNLINSLRKEQLKF